jgi:ATP-dependent Clp protease ATP-binding subunit ClpB
VNFTNVVFIMTSNLVGDPQEYFRPEFINRVDDIIRFRSLDEKDLEVIVGIQLGRLRQRLAERRLVLDVTPAAAHVLAAEGYDPAYGARPLKRVIQRRLEDPLALAVLQGTYKEGDTITVDATDGVITFH